MTTATLKDVAVFIFLISKKRHISLLLSVSMEQKRSGQNMIELEAEKNRNLKNVKQIGTPREENKIYIENMAYNKIKEDRFQERKVFVLMGHTERMEAKYATFVEAVIPVREIGFSGGVPRWNNAVWSEVFREIKRLYDDMIIVGWAFDAKGMSPKLTPDLERVHREHFGGVHQLLFLLDTLEQEETFYIYKENKVVFKDGFYIYHKARSKESPISMTRQERIPITVLPEKSKSIQSLEKDIEVEVDVPKQEIRSGGRYRQMMQEPKKQKKDGGNIGIAVAVAMLVFVIGVGVYENSDSIQTNLLQNQNSTEVSGEDVNESDTQSSSNIIDVEVIPGSE